MSVLTLCPVLSAFAQLVPSCARTVLSLFFRDAFNYPLLRRARESFKGLAV